MHYKTDVINTDSTSYTYKIMLKWILLISNCKWNAYIYKISF